MSEGRARTNLTEGLLLAEGREALSTSPIDARPVAIFKMPEDSYTPFLLGLFVSLVFVGLLLHWWVFTAVSTAAGSVALAVWLWPRQELAQRATAEGPIHG